MKTRSILNRQEMQREGYLKKNKKKDKDFPSSQDFTNDGGPYHGCCGQRVPS